MWVFPNVGCRDRQTLVIHDISDFKADLREQLVTAVLRETDGPWEGIDGIGGECRMMPGGILFVRQTEYAHPEVQRLIRDIRKSLQTSSTSNAEQP